jgi:hypothetical protein
LFIVITEYPTSGVIILETYLISMQNFISEIIKTIIPSIKSNEVKERLFTNNFLTYIMNSEIVCHATAITKARNIPA